MWPKSYRDYLNEAPLIKEKVEPGKGIIGCEMHEMNGWGTTYHRQRVRKRFSLYKFFCRLFGKK